jgi:hypothetical protein
MSEWKKLDKKVQEDLKKNISDQVKSLLDDSPDSIINASNEHELQEIGENTWDMYIGGSVEQSIEDIGYENDEDDDEGPYQELYDSLNDYYWDVFNEEAKKLRKE